MNPDKSEFNEAISFLNRLNEIFYTLMMAKRECNIDSWKIELSNLYMHLYNDCKDDERLRFKAELNSIFDEVNRHFIKVANTGMNVIPKELYWKLYNFELALVEIYDRAGYQTKRREDAKFALK